MEKKEEDEEKKEEKEDDDDDVMIQDSFKKWLGSIVRIVPTM